MEEIEFDYTGRSPRAAPIRIDDGARIARYAEGFPETFAGRWLERDSVGTRVVAFTDSPELHLAALRSLHPRGPSIRWPVRVDHLLAEICLLLDSHTWSPP